MALFLLDSNIIIDALNRKNNQDKTIRTLLFQEHVLASCPITISEVYAGMRDHERGRIEILFDSLLFLEITEQIARQSGLLKREWQQKGITLSLPDATLAAVAIENNAIFVTQNVKDFPMPEIHLYRDLL